MKIKFKYIPYFCIELHFINKKHHYSMAIKMFFGNNYPRKLLDLRDYKLTETSNTKKIDNINKREMISPWTKIRDTNSL